MPELSVLPPRYWRSINYYYHLEATQCRRCGRIYYPPRARCVCGSTDMARVRLSEAEKFVLEQYTCLHSVPVEFEKAKPLGFGVVRAITSSGQDVKILAALTDFLTDEELSSVLGQEVEPVFRVVKRDKTYGLICYGLKFRAKKV